jgi:hypothetical protein
MTKFDNMVAVDWREGPDRIYFFFRPTNTYSRFDIGENKVPDGYPEPVPGNWKGFDIDAGDLAFGFTTTVKSWDGGNHTLWLFFRDGGVPSVCKFNQFSNEAEKICPVQDTEWAVLLPYFDKIVGVMWESRKNGGGNYRILLNDGNYLIYDKLTGTLKVHALAGSNWKKLEYYKDRFVTAALNDHPTFDAHFYVFLTRGEYLKYELNNDEVFGPYTINEASWPGLD